MILALVAVLPVVGFAGIQGQRLADAERRATLVELNHRTFALASRIERYLQSVHTIAITLAISQSAKSGDVAAFRRLATKALTVSKVGRAVALVDVHGRMLVNTRYPLDAALSIVGDQAGLAETLATHAPHIGNLFTSSIGRQPTFSVWAPVMVDNEVRSAIEIAVNLDELAAILREETLPVGWRGTIHDGEGIILASSVAPERWVGTPGVASAIAAQQRAASGTDELVDKDGVPVTASFVRLASPGWTIAVGVPTAMIDAPAMQSRLFMLGLGMIALAIAGLLSIAVGRRMSREIAGVTQGAIAVGQGLAPTVVPSSVRELREASAALTAASNLIAGRAAELSERKALLHAATDHAGVGLVILDRDHRYRFANRAFCRMFGLPDDIIGRRAAEMFGPIYDQQIAPYLQRAFAGDRNRGGLSWPKPGDASGEMNFYDLRSEPAFDGDGDISGVVVAILDITESKRIEADLQRLTVDLETRVSDEVAAREAAQARAAHAERMQALGQLAGGIAHDLNNVLQAVQGSALLIERRAPDREDVLRLARKVLTATARGAAITSRLLSFARRADLRAEVFDVGVMLDDLRDILSHALGSDVAVRLEIQPGLPCVIADKGQLETVLVNLATNARDAMPDGGLLTFSADATGAAGGADRPPGLTQGDYIRLRVSDTGSGMDETTLRRSTEPFFTTKPTGKGTGLGLAMARGFADQSSGALAVASALGAGTTVTLWLPQATATKPSALPAGGDASQGADALVLLVDDEPLVLDALAEQLEAAGFRTITASNAAEALSCLAANPTISVLVSDLTMPGGMNGVALIREAQARRPGLPVVLLTGYAGDGTSTELALSGLLGNRFTLLRKPVSGAWLADRIAALLADRLPISV